MSVSRRIAFAVAVSWVSRFLTILANLFLIPVMFRHMGKEELGLWLLLNNSQAFLGLLGLGIAPTLTRHIAFAKGKSDGDTEFTQESSQHIGDLVVTGKNILQFLAIIVFFIAWLLGNALIKQLQLSEISPQVVSWSWTLMCVGYAIGFSVSYLECWLKGIGYVDWNSMITTGVAITTIFINLVVIVLGGGILTLAVISVCAALFQRFAIWVFVRFHKPPLVRISGKWNPKYAINFVRPSAYCWLTGIGGFLILRTDDYFIALFGSVNDIPAYRASYQFVSTLFMLVAPIAGSASVFISQMWQAQKIADIHRLVIRNCCITLCIMGAGVAFVLTAGKEFLEFWLGEGNFIGYPILIVFSIMLTLEAQHNVLAQSARATEDEKYVFAAITSGILNVIFTFLLIRQMGLFGVALATMLSQLLTSNWYAVYRPIVRLKLRFKQYISKVIILSCLNFICCFSSSIFLQFLTRVLFGYTKIGTILSSILACSLIFAYFIWSQVLEEYHRKTLRKKLFFLG